MGRGSRYYLAHSKNSRWSLTKERAWPKNGRRCGSGGGSRGVYLGAVMKLIRARNPTVAAISTTGEDEMIDHSGARII